MRKLLLTLAALFAPAAAQAANDVALTSEVFVERSLPDTAGRSRLVLEAPKVVVPGDHLVFVLGYKNMGARPATDFVVTNPMPNAVLFDGAADAAALVSVDGGRTWGALSALRVRAVDGTLRSARAEDVTHVRWTMKSAIPAGAGGKLSFRGIVK